jgi:hypothetical protein
MLAVKQRVEVRADADWFDRVRREANRVGLNVPTFLRFAVSQHLEHLELRGAERRRSSDSPDSPPFNGAQTPFCPSF